MAVTEVLTGGRCSGVVSWACLVFGPSFSFGLVLACSGSLLVWFGGVLFGFVCFGFWYGLFCCFSELGWCCWVLVNLGLVLVLTWFAWPFFGVEMKREDRHGCSSELGRGRLF